MGLAVVAMIVIATPISTLVGSRSWANSLKQDAKAGDQPSEGPFPIRLVLQPEIGIATIETDASTQAACVLRISERVFLGTEAVVVRDALHRHNLGGTRVRRGCSSTVGVMATSSASPIAGYTTA